MVARPHPLPRPPLHLLPPHRPQPRLPTRPGYAPRGGGGGGGDVIMVVVVVVVMVMMWCDVMWLVFLGCYKLFFRAMDNLCLKHEIESAALYKSDRAKYDKTAKEWTMKYASQ